MYSIERARQVRELELFLYNRRSREIKYGRDEHDEGDLIGAIEGAIEVDIKTGRVTFIDRIDFPKV